MLIKKLTKFSTAIAFFIMAIAALVCASTVQATLFDMEATLNGLQEVPPNASPATGTADITYNDITNLLSWDIEFSGLLGTVTAAHFHGPAPIGLNAGVKVPIGVLFIGSATINELDESDLLNGLWYINIHTSVFPGGEIRGQVNQVVPEPSTLLLLGSGLIGLVGIRRRFKA